MNVGEWLAAKANELLSNGNKYTKPDGTIMVEVAPYEYVNKEAAVKLGLYRRAR